MKSHGENILMAHLQYLNKAFSTKKQKDKLKLLLQTQFLNCFNLFGHSNYIKLNIYIYFYNDNA